MAKEIASVTFAVPNQFMKRFFDEGKTMLIDLWEFINRLRRLFGLEYIERLDRQILDPSLLQEGEENS